MRKATLRAELNRAVNAARFDADSSFMADSAKLWATGPIRQYDVVKVVEIKDYESTTAAFAKLELEVGTQRTEIAALRMLLREADAQLKRVHETAKTTSPDYRRLSQRIDRQLAHTTNGATE